MMALSTYLRKPLHYILAHGVLPLVLLGSANTLPLQADCVCTAAEHCGCFEGQPCRCDNGSQEQQSQCTGVDNNTYQDNSFAEGWYPGYDGDSQLAFGSYQDNDIAGGWSPGYYADGPSDFGSYQGYGADWYSSYNPGQYGADYGDGCEEGGSCDSCLYGCTRGRPWDCATCETRCGDGYLNIYGPRYRRPRFIPNSDNSQWPCCTTGGWMPQRPPLFRPFIADPRQLCYSAGWRFNDDALTKNVIDVSYYDTFPIYGWCNAWLCGDKLQLDLDGCLWAVFDPCTYSAPLMNADYYVGLHLSYAYYQWSFRARFFHISSHVGDEFLLNHPHFVRRNPSAEYTDIFASYQFTDDIRFYWGFGYVLNMDHSFCIGRFYTEGGFETRVTALGCEDTWNHIYAVPFLAIHYRYHSDFKKHSDLTYALGYEIGKTNCLCQRLRVYMEYHDGYSVEGQWSRVTTSYFSIRGQYSY